MLRFVIAIGLVLSLVGASIAQEAVEKEADNSELEMPATDAEGVELPELLTLGEALSLANNQHPAVLSAQATQMAANASQLESEVSNSWRAGLNLEGRYTNRGNDDNGYFDDSRYELKISKLLSDFGQSAAQATASRLSIESSQLNLDYTERLQRIEVIAKYLDVVAAEFKYAADNEAMTLAFFPWDRARERRDRFDSESEVTVLRLQTIYQKVLAKRNQTQQEQRKTRFRLASAMGWPDAKPVSVLEPDLSTYARPVPDYDELVAKAIPASPVLTRMRLEHDALVVKTDSANQRVRPKVSINLYASDYERYYTTKDDTRAVLQLEIPLLDGGRHKVEVVRSSAQVLAKEAEITQYEFMLREQVINWVQRLEYLEAAIANNEVALNYQERALDKARLLYEMEVRVRLGSAMAEMAQTQYEGAKARFERAIIWEQIDAMLGVSPVEIKS